MSESGRGLSFRAQAVAATVVRALGRWCREKPGRVLLACATLLLMTCALRDLAVRLAYEARGPFSTDAPIYSAIGRGILNHVPLYSGMFETKPPLIFLLFALSWKTCGSWALATDIQVAAIVAIFFAPLLLVYRERSSIRNLPRKVALAILGGACVALYTAVRAGEIQAESFGAAALLPWILVCSRHPDRPPEATLGRLLLGSASVAVAVMTKEPFLLAAIAVGLVNARSRRDWVEFALMVGLAGLLAALALAVTGAAHGYLGVYLPQMLGHVAFSKAPLRTGSLLVRTLELTHLWDDLWSYAPGLCVALTAASLSAMAVERREGRPALSMLIRWALALFVTSFAIGLSGFYYRHQYVFLVPLAMAILMAWLLTDTAPSGKLIAFSSAAAALGLAVATISHDRPDLDAELASSRGRAASAKTAATQIDRALDCTGETRYAYVGGAGVQPWGWTKHSPLGPWFFQYVAWFPASEKQRRAELLNALKQARLVVFRGLSAGDFDEPFRKAIDARFQPGLPPKCASIALAGPWTFRWAAD